MAIADSKYVSITTFRKSGVAVSSPVWIAPLGDGRCGFTTGATSGKVKRIAHTPRVTLRPCDVRGRVAADAMEVTATAEVLTGLGARSVERAIVKKYGLLARAMVFGGSVGDLVAKVRKRTPEPDCAVVLTLE